MFMPIKNVESGCLVQPIMAYAMKGVAFILLSVNPRNRMDLVFEIQD
uniref:Uncharacterized protein n=1 Tax=Arundo donax TaxID=35708 RepID=A0A0A9AC98_ARUDO